MKANARRQPITTPDDGRHGGYRDHTGRENRMPNERIEQCRFAAFELTDARHIESSF
jgi:hypothetical protein